MYYLDWLRVVATLGVFLFHAVHPFDFVDWETKNVEQSMIVTLFIVFFAPWGMPFLPFHQPVIIAIAFYVVQWEASILMKLLVVVLSSFVVTLGLYEAVVRRIGPLRALFSMKSPRPTRRGLLAG